ncbi:MAG: MerC domain-containing protein [Candidatus Poseidoniaceae archaeon]|nr:MerC domain-containing protein [Candidatus Poseidoniaceae archaeon]
MHSTSRVAYSSPESNDVKIDSLYLDGASGKVVANIDERMVSLEAKSGHGLDIKIHSINRVQHHHTRLVPGYIAIIGLALVWSSVRIFATSSLQIITLIGGLSLIIGWAVTRKPTLTIDTDAGDCHVITGNDFSLLKLNTILLKLQKGFSLEEAADGLEILESDAQYPRNSIFENNEVPVEIAVVTSPESIATFLSSDIAESVAPEPEIMPVMDMSIFDSQMPPILPPVEAPQHNTPSWQEMANERRERIPSINGNSLIERGINNVGDRRGREDSHPMSMFNQLDLDLPTAAEEPRNQLPINQSPNAGLLSHIESTQANEAGPAQMPTLLPSFWNRDGYHNPNEADDESVTTDLTGFNSPDTLLGNIDFEGNTIESLVASARRESNPIRPVSESMPINQNSRLRKKNPSNNSRLIKRRNANNNSNQRRGRLVPSISNAVRDLGTSITNRIINTFEESNQPNSNLRERADEAQQDELETFRNLAQGGLIPDEKARELEENVRRRKALIEQNEQEFADSSDELSWTELIDSDEHKSSTAGKGGLPRIDL